jgi:hypothetical protein
MAADGHRGTRYMALVIACLLLIALLFPAFEGLSLLGAMGDKTYLLIFQDNGEIRPDGGLMACMGLLTMHDGSVKSLRVYFKDNSSWTGGVVPLDGPTSLTEFLNVNEVRLYDSNVQYDFASFAPIMLSDFYKLTGQQVDGIIAIDFTALEAILRITGPISVSGDIITSRNVADRFYYYFLISGDDKTLLTDKLSSLAFTLIETVRDASLLTKLNLLNAVRQLGSEKHLFCYVPGNVLTQSFAGASATPPGDFIMVVDMNMGSGKADFGVNRTIDYHVELLANGSTVSNLTLTYENHCFWSYNLFTTVLVPPGAELINATSTSESFNGPLVTGDANDTAFSASMPVPSNGTSAVTYQYTLPPIVQGSGVGTRYDLYMIKQAGIVEYTLNTAVQLPQGSTLVHTENVGTGQTATGNTHVQVVYRQGIGAL